MGKSRFTEERIIGVLKEHQAWMPVAKLCRKHGVSDATFYGCSLVHGSASGPG